MAKLNWKGLQDKVRTAKDAQSEKEQRVTTYVKTTWKVPLEPVTCKCGKPMQLVFSPTAKVRGNKDRNFSFWGCTQYPFCKFIRSADQNSWTANSEPFEPKKKK